MLKFYQCWLFRIIRNIWRIDHLFSKYFRAGKKNLEGVPGSAREQLKGVGEIAHEFGVLKAKVLGNSSELDTALVYELLCPQDDD